MARAQRSDGPKTRPSVNNTMARGVFFALERARREPVGRCLAELRLNERLEPAAIQQLQQNKLQELLRFAFRRNDYFRRRMSSYESVKDLTSIPVLTKKDLRTDYNQIITPGFNRLDLVKTSGSTGEPLKFYRDRTVFAHTLASVLRGHAWHGIEVGAKEAMLWGIPAGRTHRMQMRLRDALLNRFRERDYTLDPVVLLEFYQKMLRRGPDYLYGYSSMVYEFALFVMERQLPGRELGLKGVVCTAESIHDYQRAAIERTFGCRVISEYGSAETGIISYECAHGRHHISDDCVYVEILDDDNKPVGVGDVGKVTVTVLHSFAAPIIRYQLGDYASLSDETCKCGVNLSLIDQIVGRTSGIIVTPSGRCFHSIVLYYIMKDFADNFGGVRQFKVRQTAIDHLEFHVVPSGHFGSEAREWISRMVKTRLGNDISIDFIEHSTIARAASGKLRDFESTLDVEKYLLNSYGDADRVTFSREGNIG